MTEEILRNLDEEKQSYIRESEEQQRNLREIQIIVKRSPIVIDKLVEMCNILKPYRIQVELYQEIRKPDLFYKGSALGVIQLTTDLLDVLHNQYPLYISGKEISIDRIIADVLPNILAHLKAYLEEKSNGMNYIMPLEDLSKQINWDAKAIKNLIKDKEILDKIIKFRMHNGVEHICIEGFNLLKLFNFYDTHLIRDSLQKHIIFISMLHNYSPYGKEFSKLFNLILGWNTAVLVAITYLHTRRYYFTPRNAEKPTFFKNTVLYLTKVVYKKIATNFGAKHRSISDKRNMEYLHSFRRNESIILNNDKLIIEEKCALMNIVRAIRPKLLQKLPTLERFFVKEREREKIRQ